MPVAEDEYRTAPVTPAAGAKVVVAPNAALTWSGFAAKAFVNAAWSKVTVPSRVTETPGAPAPATRLSIRCCRARVPESPTSAPPVFVLVSYAVRRRDLGEHGVHGVHELAHLAGDGGAVDVGLER